MQNGYEIDVDCISVEYFSENVVAKNDGFDHCHDKYEITFTTAASGKYIIEGSEHKLCPGAIIFIQPLSYHKVLIDKACLLEGYTVYFSENAISEGLLPILKKITDKSDYNGRYYSHGHYSDAIISAFERFETARILKDEDQKAYLSALLSEIIILLSAAEGDSMTAIDELGARVVKYLNSNIDKNISLEKVAKRFFVSKYHLCRAFKKHSGISVHSYINHKRIMYAKQLIESGETASGAAERVGFGDYSAFYRAYIKIVGKSPTKE